MASLNTNSEYQFEVRGLYTYNDVPAYFGVDSDTYGLEASYYYSPVRLGEHPYAEAAFLQGVGSIDLSVWHSAWKAGCNDYCSQINVEQNQVSLTTRNYFANYLYLEGTYNYSDYEYQSQYRQYDRDSDYWWYASIGVMPLEGLLITSNFNKDNSLFENGWNLGAKYVLPLSDTNAINIEVSYSNPDGGDDVWLLETDYYLTQRLSIGGSYETQSERYTARSSWYLNKYFAIDVEYRELYEGDSYTLGVSSRF